MKRIFLLLFFILFIQQQVLAQVGGRGGGRIKEVEASQLMLDLIPYLQSPGGLAKFPEIERYNRMTKIRIKNKKETFFDVMRSIHFVMINGRVMDSFRGDRDCVTYIKDPKRRITRCNENAFPDLNLNNQRILYTFVLHEAFIATGIEAPLDPEIESVYPVASRLSFYKKSVEVWAPGESDSSARVDTQANAETDFFSCRALDSHFRVSGTTHGLTGQLEMSLGSAEVDEINMDYTVLPLTDLPKKIVGPTSSYFLIEKNILWDNMHTFRSNSKITVIIKAPWFHANEDEINQIELRGSVNFTRSQGRDLVAVQTTSGAGTDYQYVERPSVPETVELVCKVNPKIFVKTAE